jgi:hypothetical protein
VAGTTLGASAEAPIDRSRVLPTRRPGVGRRRDAP